VRNLADGTVEIHAAGSAAAVADFRRRLSDGPPAARVDSITDIPPPPATAGDGADFVILL
jgi:acylphosphatase